MTSRRNFLTGSVAAAAATFASATHAAPVMKPAKFDETFDFVVVGAGGAGLCAAAHAAENGIKTVVFEKMGIAGGSSALCGGAWSVGGSEMQKSKGIEDSDEKFFADMMKTGQNMNDPELVKTFVKYSKKEYQWITKQGVKPSTVSIASGMSVPRAHRFNPEKVVEFYLDYAQKKGAAVRFNAKVERLLWDAENDRICGVKVTAEGKTKHIGARFGVLLANGGFSRNPVLLGKYAPPMRYAAVIAGAGTAGDGMLMAQAYGAEVIDTCYIKATFGYQLGNYPDSMHCYYAGAIIVNHAGNRFVNESISYKLLSDAALAQPDEYTFQLFDENIRQRRIKEHPRNAMILTNPALNEGKDTSFCFVGKTLDEVAKKAGVNAETLKKTVAQYNADVDKGVDSKFGRTSLTSGYGKMLRIEKPPFFLYPSKPRCIATYCGVRINSKARVINVFGEEIPGLYACGEVTGGVHGAAYMTGTALGKAFSFGRIAVLDMAKTSA